MGPWETLTSRCFINPSEKFSTQSLIQQSGIEINYQVAPSVGRVEMNEQCFLSLMWSSNVSYWAPYLPIISSDIYKM